MADVRSRVAVKITDPTTNANEAGVTAAGNLKVDIAAQTLSLVVVDTEMPAAAALADAASAVPSTSTIGVVPLVMNATTVDRQRAVVNALDSVGVGIAAAGLVGQLDDTTPSAVTENQFAPVRISTRRALLIEGVASGTNINVALAASSATVTVDSELPAAAAITADAQAAPTAPSVYGWLMGFNGTNWDRVRTANTGQLQVDVITGGGADAPTSAQRTRATSAAVAAGSSANLDSAQITSAKTGKLERCICSASVPIKVDLYTVLNGTATIVATWFVPANNVFSFETRHRNYIQQAESATMGFDGFRATVTNNDNNTAADLYAFFAYDEV